MDGEIEYRMKSKIVMIEIKREQEFYTLEFHPNKKKK